VASGSFHFDRFALDPDDRLLRRDDAAVELNARYLDALILLVRERGKLVSKERFLEEVWRGVPVTDEALTQCIKTLRKQLGDDAGAPRFIETAPKYGYRFIAPVAWIEDGAPAPAKTPPAAPSHASRQVLLLGAAGTIGGGAAGLVGGLLYSVVGAAAGIGAASALVVLVCMTALVGVLGGAGVGFGVAAAELARRKLGQWIVFGGATGGLLVGGVVKLIGLDAFDLLFGQTPGAITGAGEGALLGGAVGLAVWLARRATPQSLRGGVAIAALCGAAAGVVIVLLGGRLMAGSLDLLAQAFPDSRLHLDAIGALFGESGFGPVSLMLSTAAEAALFSAGVVGAMLFAQRRGLAAPTGLEPVSPL
jgi:DNA-binding winged helix-turn-helix (wHTH) protein